jgi:hypothetical protein
LNYRSLRRRFLEDFEFTFRFDKESSGDLGERSGFFGEMSDSGDFDLSSSLGDEGEERGLTSESEGERT